MSETIPPTEFGGVHGVSGGSTISRALWLERRSEKMARKGRGNGGNDIFPSHIYRVRPAQLAAVASLANSSRSSSRSIHRSNMTNISATVAIATVLNFH